MRTLEYSAHVVRLDNRNRQAIKHDLDRLSDSAIVRTWSVGSNLIYIIGDWLDSQPRRWAWVAA